MSETTKDQAVVADSRACATSLESTDPKTVAAQWHTIQVECRAVVRALVNHGDGICSAFEAHDGSNYFCRHCHYTQYVHLAKRITELS